MPKKRVTALHSISTPHKLKVMSYWYPMLSSQEGQTSIHLYTSSKNSITIAGPIFELLCSWETNPLLFCRLDKSDSGWSRYWSGKSRWWKQSFYSGLLLSIFFPFALWTWSYPSLRMLTLIGAVLPIQFKKTFEGSLWRKNHWIAINVNTHPLTHLKTNLKSNKCNQCDFACAGAESYRRHLKAHSGYI